MNRPSPPARIRTDVHPGDIGAVIRLHGTVYAEEHGFDHTFEPYVAIPLGEMIIRGSDRERIWIVETNDGIGGSIAIVENSPHLAQLRWLILHPDLRGQSLGRRLIQEAISFSKGRGYKQIFLWTLNILPPATRLYQSEGFRLTEEKTHRLWGRMLTEERYDLDLD